MTDFQNSEKMQVNDSDDEISVLDLLILLVKHRKLILGFPLIVAMVAAGYALYLPSIYTASAKLLPPQQGQSSGAALLAQLGGLGGVLNAAVGRSSAETFIAMLKSRVVIDNLIQRFDLASTPEEKKHLSSVRADLAGRTNIQNGKDGLISVEVDDTDPKRAADLANAYVDELMKLTNVMAVTEASLRRLFYEKQFEQAKTQLADAEVAARQALQTGGLIKVDDQGITMMQSTSRLRAQITFKEVQLSAMRAFAAEGNPELRRGQEEVASMRRELAKMEQPGPALPEKVDATGKKSDALRLLREVKYREALYDLMARQYEMSKVDEARDSASLIQVLETAIEPDRKSKPRRTIIVIASGLVAMLLSILFVILRETLAKAASDPRRAQQMQALKAMLSWKRSR